MAVVGELLAVTALLLFSANVALVGAATRRVPQDLGFLLAPVSNAVAVCAVGGLLTAFVGR